MELLRLFEEQQKLVANMPDAFLVKTARLSTRKVRSHFVLGRNNSE